MSRFIKRIVLFLKIVTLFVLLRPFGNILFAEVDDNNAEKGSSFTLLLVFGILGGLVVVALVVAVLLFYNAKKKKKQEMILCENHMCPYKQKCGLPECMSYAMLPQDTVDS